MVGATIDNILNGSHHVKDAAQQFNYIVVDNRFYKKQQQKVYKNLLTKGLLKSLHVFYFAAALPNIVSLIVNLRKCSKKVKKSFSKPNFSIKDHVEYTEVRNLLDSLSQDLVEIKKMYSRIAVRKFPLKVFVLAEFLSTITVLEQFLCSAEVYLKKFNKPVLAKHGSKVLPEAKQWKSRVKAYEFIA